MMFRRDLKEVFTNTLDGEGPPTYLRGTTKIDVIWISGHMHVRKYGYLDTEHSIGDHRILWVVVCGYLQLCAGMCGCVRFCAVMCGCVRLCAFMCVYVWLCAAMCGYVRL